MWLENIYAKNIKNANYCIFIYYTLVYVTLQHCRNFVKKFDTYRYADLLSHYTYIHKLHIYFSEKKKEKLTNFKNQANKVRSSPPPFIFFFPHLCKKRKGYEVARCYCQNFLIDTSDK